ncbi:MAG TPA: type IV secretion system DNA-binding domain-containing protein [Solirubrobacteraceae bacterium]|nr:type IV secretion system DNA-binding domain-containing protein [Solirubrobacteraceae bacterium]
MPSSTYTTEPAVNPLAPLAELAGWLISTTLHVALGLLAGMIAARAMRGHHLRWTWAAPALVPVVLDPTMFFGWATTLAVGGVCAAVRGRRWHREDLMAGGDLAEIASRRRGPFDALRALTRELRARLAAVSPPTALCGGRMPIGRTESGETMSIPFGAGDGGRHTLIVGATGSGKTVTETWIVARAIEAGMGAVVIDPKGDARLREHLDEAAREVGRRFLQWTPWGPSVYNPFGHGEASEIADKALAGERFTEPHYQRQAQRYLGYAVRTLRGAGVEVSLPALVEQLDPENLAALCLSLPEPQQEVTDAYLNSLTPRQRTDLSGVRDRLAIVVESDVSPWLDPATAGADTFELLGAIEERAVVYFDLKADAWPLLAHMLGVAIVQDLQTTMAALQHAPIATVVAIDEFAAIAAGRVGHLFGRARSAGINLLLGTQELSDLRPDGHKQLQEQVLGNLASLIVHRQVVPESSELISRLAGSRGVWRTSQSDKGRWTRTRTSASLLAAQDIRALPTGWAAAIDLDGGATVRVGQVFSAVAKATTSKPTTRRSA